MTMTQARRPILALAACCLMIAAAPANAAGAGASGFVRSLGDQLISIVNAPGTPASKRGELQQIVDQDIAVEQIARFCLGRYIQTATPAQRAEYVQLFHSVLLNAIVGHLGGYHGVRILVGQTTDLPDGAHVATTIERPGESPANVDWVIAGHGAPAVVDIVAEGTSLRTTQRGDYTSYLSRHNGDIAALLAALRRQVGREDQG